MRKTLTYKIRNVEPSTIVVGENILDDLTSLLLPFKHTGFFVLCDEYTKKIYEERAKKSMSVLGPVHLEILKAGEREKQIETVVRAATSMLGKIDRKGAVIAIGGGVVGDIATLLAGLYYRGIDCIQIPTTLLAQVDAAVGGKGGVNLGMVKNVLGVVKQPKLIISDTSLLSSLSDGKLRSGMGEVIKYAISQDPTLFENLERATKLSSSLLSKIVHRTTALKMAVVVNDPNERSYHRMTLNFGHTLGHAVELTKDLSHGEAVAVGMAFAIRLSVLVGNLSKVDAHRALQLIKKYELPTTVSSVKENEVIDMMQKDKKIIAGKLRFVLLKGIGQAYVQNNVSDSLVKNVLKEVLV